MQELYVLKEKLMKELCEYGKKDTIDTVTLNTIDTIAHALKNVCKVIRDCEMDGYSNMPPYYDDMSYGRRRNAMGQYSRDGGYPDHGYSMGMMNQNPNEYVRQKMYDAMRGM